MVRCPPGKYDFTASSKSDCPQRRRNTRLRAYHSLSEEQQSVYRHIVTLRAHYRGGPLVTRDCFWRQIPHSCLPRFSFFCRGFSSCRFLLPACQGQKPVLNLRSVHCMRSLCCRPDFAEYETGKQLQARRKWRRILTDCCLTKVTSDCLSLQITYTNR